MANPEHLQILQQGVEAWNAWRAQHRDIRPDLAGAALIMDDLAGVNLAGADLAAVNFHRSNLNAATLIRSNLSAATLVGVNLYMADFSDANLTGAILTTANLTKATLTGADVSGVRLGETVFGDTNLTAVRGLETCGHRGPSTLDHRTLAKSGPLPLAFLRGCGLPDALIDYLPSLLNQPFQFYSCFISYASQDHAFAERLYADLQNKGVRCWYAPEDMKIGDEFRSRIDASIHVHDRLLLILSEHSIKSRWVQKEVETAFEKEAKENRLVLFPIRLDDVVMQIDVGWAADVRRQRHIGDFTQWKDHDAYQQSFARLLHNLTAPVPPPDASA